MDRFGDWASNEPPIYIYKLCLSLDPCLAVDRTPLRACPWPSEESSNNTVRGAVTTILCDNMVGRGLDDGAAAHREVFDIIL